MGKKTGPNSVQNRLRKMMPDLVVEDFESWHRLSMKYKHRAQARGYDSTNLTDEEWEIVTSDNIEPLAKGERVHTSWNETVGKGLIEEALEYLNRKPNTHILDNEDTVNQWLTVPSLVKLAARGLKQNNDYLLQASMLPSEAINQIKEKIDNCRSRGDVCMIQKVTSCI